MKTNKLLLTLFISIGLTLIPNHNAFGQRKGIQRQTAPKAAPLVAFKHLTVATGDCRFRLKDRYQRCESKAIFMELDNDRGVFTFSTTEKGKQVIFILSGGADRQPNLENYFLSIDKFRATIDGKFEVEDLPVRGECHIQMQPNTGHFEAIKCDIYEDKMRLDIRFYLDDIVKTEKVK